MSNLILTDFYRVALNGVRLFPTVKGKPWLQPQTFRVLPHLRGNDITSPNLGAVPTDKGTPYFWSQKWHRNKFNPNALEWEYPLVTMFDLIGKAQTSAFEKDQKRCHTVEIAVLDTYSPDGCNGKHTGGIARPVNQIYIDTGRILDGLLQYIGGSVIATRAEDATPKVYFEPWLISQRDLGNIGPYTVSERLLQMLNTNNKQSEFSRVEFSGTKIYGTKVQVTFCTDNCQAIEFKGNLADYGVVSFEAG